MVSQDMEGDYVPSPPNLPGQLIPQTPGGFKCHFKLICVQDGITKSDTKLFAKQKLVVQITLTSSLCDANLDALAFVTLGYSSQMKHRFVWRSANQIYKWEVIKMDLKKFEEAFNKEYEFLYNTKAQVEGYQEAVAFFDQLLKEDPDTVRMFARYRGDVISSDREAAAFTFTYRMLGYDKDRSAGKIYQERKAILREEAERWQNEASELKLSWAEVAERQSYFECMAKRYGLIKEFHENGIC